MNYQHNKHFGLATDPLAKLLLKTSDFTRVQDLLNDAVANNGFINLIGERGMGKTTTINAVLQQHADIAVIEPLRLERDKLKIGDIERAMIRQLSSENVKHSGEDRSYQLRRILGTASRTQKIVLIIDDAHMLHHNTLKCLKRLRELTWLGKSELLTVILVGQRDRLLGLGEVRLRSITLTLAGLSKKEIAHIVNKCFGNAFADNAAIKLVASRSRCANWLDLRNEVGILMGKAYNQNIKINAKLICKHYGIEPTGMQEQKSDIGDIINADIKPQTKVKRSA